jgi:hypothetical protein
MARFLLRLAGFAAIQLVIAVVVFCYGAPQSEEHYLSAIHDKRALLASTDGPRIIFVGGSNVAFGVSSEMIGARLQRPAINFGLHAGLGTDCPLRLVEEEIHSGDTVVVSLEYALLASMYDGGSPETVAIMLEHWPEGGRYFGAGSAAGQRNDGNELWIANQWFQRARHAIFEGRNPIYTRSAFNACGDMVAHHGVASPAPGRNCVVPALVDENLKQTIDRLNRFAVHCAKRRAQAVFSYPAVPVEEYERSRNEIQKLHAALSVQLDMPILHLPEDVVYSRDAFFDSVYHLTRAGAERRSELLASRLSDSILRIAREQPAGDRGPLRR